MGYEKSEKNAHILTVNIAVLPSLSNYFTHLLPSLFRIKRPSIVQVIIIMLAVIIREKYILNASENKFFWY